MKNKIRWKGTLNIPNDTQLDYDLIQYRKELKTLQEESAELTRYNDKLQDSFNKIASGNNYSEFTWLTYDDISKLCSSEKNKQNKMIIIKAPPETVMEIPDPEQVDEFFASLKKKPEDPIGKNKEIEDKRYQIHLCSKAGELMVYTVENEESERPPSPKMGKSLSQTEENIGETLSNMYDK